MNVLAIILAIFWLVMAYRDFRQKHYYCFAGDLLFLVSLFLAYPLMWLPAVMGAVLFIIQAKKDFKALRR